ncbi:DUF4418 family protein [Oscillibacter sp. GMB15532]|uniref:DUF4418 family protein n=1 Tax=Oscillibacter sp. GMB15532 TaxID=3230022 RepID=UPI0034E00088
MKSNYFASKLLSILLLALSAFLTLGTQFVFHACDAGADGSHMVCHWAQQGTIGAAGVLVLLHIFHLLTRDARSRAAFLIAGLPVTVLAMILPGGLIPLCMMADMRCQAVMRPAVLTVGGLILVLTVIALVLNFKRER